MTLILEQMAGFPIHWYLLLGCLVGVVAGLFGVGGGLLIVPALVWLLPITGVSDQHIMHIAIGTSLATITVTSIAATISHHRRNGVIWIDFWWLTPGLLVGAFAGGVIAGLFSGEVLRVIFGCFAITMGIRLWFHYQPDAQLRLAAMTRLISGVIIGVVSAIVGIGGGSMTVPLLHAAGREMRQAVGTSSACGLPIAVSGASGYMMMGWGLNDLPAGSLGYVYLPVALIVIVTSSLFANLGARLAHYLPGERLKAIFAVFLVFVGISLLVRH